MAGKKTPSESFQIKDPQLELRDALDVLVDIYTARHGVQFSRASVVRRVVYAAWKRERRRAEAAK
jgi:hypothetical protein